MIEAVSAIVFSMEKGKPIFLLVKRIPEKRGFWQAPGGGVEETDKTFLDAAFRELFEETGIRKEQVIRVIEDVDTFSFNKNYITDKPSETVNEHVFGFEVKGKPEIDLLHNIELEHDEYRWVTFDEATKLLFWQNNKDAFAKLLKLI